MTPSKFHEKWFRQIMSAPGRMESDYDAFKADIESLENGAALSDEAGLQLLALAERWFEEAKNHSSAGFTQCANELEMWLNGVLPRAGGFEMADMLPPTIEECRPNSGVYWTDTTRTPTQCQSCGLSGLDGHLIKKMSNGWKAVCLTRCKDGPNFQVRLELARARARHVCDEYSGCGACELEALVKEAPLLPTGQ